MRIAPSYSFARPDNTTQYAQNELVANDVDAADVVPLRWSVEPLRGRGQIQRVRLFTDNQNVTTATFNLHLFSRPPTPGAGDNGAYSVSSNEYWLGTVACDLATGAEVSATDKHKGFAVSGGISFDKHADDREGAIYGLLETAAAATYTPAALEVFKVTLEIEG